MSTTVTRIHYETRHLLRIISEVENTTMINLIRAFAENKARSMKTDDPEKWHEFEKRVIEKYGKNNGN